MAFLTQVLTPAKWKTMDAMHVLLGSLYIALLAQIEIPLNPVPVTLHNFAIFSLALFMGAKKSSYATLLYLAEATMGLPVFPSFYADPFWILDPTAGYCLAFPLSAYIVGKLSETPKGIALGVILGQLVLYVCGITWLSFFVGWQDALMLGLYPFILFDGVKLAAAACSKMALRKYLQ